ncbi:MAG: multicopper oxidase domain-containing protein [Crocinitomicaceae bacterium]|nr:multicopper oxidase domain-containing protein [Crocinitomicaceae bacterium]
MKVLFFFFWIFIINITFSQTNIFLIGRTLGEKVIATGDTLRVFGFAPNLGAHPPIPGPLIEANQGDSVHIDFWNVSQLHHHTIHLHGLDVNQANDGVPMLSFSVDHMDHGWYHFKAPHAGTYLYHCHVGSTIHLQAGMYGPIIIRPSDGSNTTWDGGYPFDTETMLFMSEFDTFWHTDSILDHEHDTTAVYDPLEIPPYTPDYFLINGLSDQQLKDSVELLSITNYENYFRLVNIGYCSNKVIFPSALSAEIIDSDGRPLPTIETTDTIEIYPGERYGVLAKSAIPINDSIQIQYFDMMTGELKNTQYVSVEITDANKLSEFGDLTELTLVPNPVDNELSVNFNLLKKIPLSYRITSYDGKLIFAKNLPNFDLGKNSFKINTSSLKSGRYLMSLINHKNIVSKKFIKL